MERVKQLWNDGFSEKTFLWLKLTQDTTGTNLMTFYLGVFITIMCYTFINAAQAYVLKNMLGFDDLGKPTGDLGFYNELVIIATVWLWGTFSDKYGRKIVYFFAFFFMALGMYLYPFANEFYVLVIYRLIFAVGASAAAAMLTAVLADYVIAQDKGKASGLMGLFSGFGALFAALILLQIPDWSSLDTIPAGRLMYIVAGTVVICTAFVMLMGLKRKGKEEPIHQAYPHILLMEGLKAGWNNSRLSLAFASGFVARGDSLVLTTFLSLWIQDYAVDVLGKTEDEAISMAGQITGIAQTCALIFALPAGYMCSKMDSVKALLILTIVALFGYGGICFTEDPTGSYGMLCACIIGVGEIGVIVGAQALASKYSPSDLRGSVGGTVGLCGSLGILVCSKVGGILYDDWKEIGPFALFAGFNAILIIWATIVFFKTRKQDEQKISSLERAEKEEEETQAPLLVNQQGTE